MADDSSEMAPAAVVDPTVSAPAVEGDDALVGPALPAAKKRKVLQHEAAYLQGLPLAEMYEKSYMHRDTVTHVAAAQATDFLITGSVDGHIKFWKKQAVGVEFAKHYKAHLGPVTGLAVSRDGTLCASISSDKTVKVFDVINFDMIAMLRLPFVPSCAEWVYKKGAAKMKLAIADATSPAVHMYDMRGGSDEPLATMLMHTSPVLVMRYNALHDTVISGDSRGVLDYWSPSNLGFPTGEVSFSLKLDTDLYALAKAKALPRSLEVSADGTQFAVVGSDWRVRVFRFASGKLRRTFDESADAASELQRSDSEFQLEPIDFGRRMAVEKELAAEEEAPWPNAIFDESGHFLLYATLLGIKVVNLVTNRCVKVVGRVENTERFLRIALFQGSSKRGKLKLHDDAKVVEQDPTLIACAFRKQRFFLFTRREPSEGEDAGTGRDVFNEKPSGEDLHLAQAAQAGAAAALPRGAVIHTTLGDISVKLFPDECPRTVENFTTHAAKGYYDGIIFHRIIKGFMLQTGDPEGDGTGGESIWGGEFEDEFSRNLRHDRPFTLSMANAGPNTNGSQFFITTVPTPWLDNKHTVFGRVVKGTDVVLAIEKAKTDRFDKPVEDIKMLNIENKSSVE